MHKIMCTGAAPSPHGRPPWSSAASHGSAAVSDGTTTARAGDCYVTPDAPCPTPASVARLRPPPRPAHDPLSFRGAGDHSDAPWRAPPPPGGAPMQQDRAYPCPAPLVAGARNAMTRRIDPEPALNCAAMCDGRGDRARDALEVGEVHPPSPSRAPSLRPATVPLTASASLNGICNRQ